jgi:hypothetical protein
MSAWCGRSTRFAGSKLRSASAVGAMATMRPPLTATL